MTQHEVSYPVQETKFADPRPTFSEFRSKLVLDTSRPPPASSRVVSAGIRSPEEHWKAQKDEEKEAWRRIQDYEVRDEPQT